MKKLLFLGACLVALASSPVRAQAVGTDIVVVKAYEESYTLILDIARAGTKPEHRLFKLKDLDELGGGNTTAGIAEATRRLLVELAQQGYSLTATYGTTDRRPTTLVFTKR